MAANRPAPTYAILQPGGSNPGASARRHHLHALANKETIDPTADTLWASFEKGHQKNPGGPCLGTRFAAPGQTDVMEFPGDYTWMTYAQVHQKAVKIGRGLIALGLAQSCSPDITNLNDVPGACMVGLFSQNRAEWVLAEQGCNSVAVTTVPLYDTLGHEAVRYIVAHTGLPTVVVSRSKLKELLMVKSDSLKNVVLMDGDPTPDEKLLASTVGMRLLSLAEVEAAGAAELPQDKFHRPRTHMLATICFTSGTTGNPKGAMLSHRNIIADAAGAWFAGVKLELTDVHISYLPLAHMFERCVQVMALFCGAAIGFFRGNVLKLKDDLASLRPTIFPSVPRLFNKFHDRIQATFDAITGCKACLVSSALAAKRAGLAQGKYTHWLWDALVFKNTKAILGGRCRLMVTGSAPIAANVMDLLRMAMCCPLVEGYGQTECGAAATITQLGDTSTGHVGGPMPCNDVKLVDVPEMNYVTVNPGGNPRGEVCFKGPNVFSGYFKDEAHTREALDDEGWLHSGDIGEWLPNGALRIIDRKKNIFKLSQGEYVAAEKIENILVTAPLVAQVFVYGDSLQSVLVAVVVPDVEVCKTQPWGADLQALCKNPEFKKAVAKELAERSTSGGLKSFEKVKDFHLHHELFSVDNDLLTPTFKLKRPQAKKMFQAQIDSLYVSINANAPKDV